MATIAVVIRIAPRVKVIVLTTITTKFYRFALKKQKLISQDNNGLRLSTTTTTTTTKH